MNAVAIDIGGTNTRVSLINKDYKIITNTKFSTLEDPVLEMDKIASVIESFNVEYLGIGVSCPGPLDLKNGIVLTPPNMLSWHHYKLVEELEKRTNSKVLLENDANLASLAEATIGDGKDKNVVLFYTVSTGIGGGLVVNNKIYQGAHGSALEVANCKFTSKSYGATNLIDGAVETIASGKNMTIRARKLGLDVENPSDIYNLANSGNEKALLVREEAYDNFAKLISCSIAMLDPEIIILGGSVSIYTPNFIGDIKKRVSKLVFPEVAKHLDIRKTSIGEDNGILGAACLVFNSFKA